MDSDARPATPDERIDAADPYPAHPVTNVVVHTGDAVVPDTALGDGNAEFRLHDADGRHYATLVAHAIGAGAYRVATVQYVGRRLLPLRPLAQPEPVTVAGGNTTAVTGPLYGAYEYTVTHAHWHTHASPDGRPDGDPAHTHDHQHAGTAAAGANALGHGDDLHTHAH